jgi:hypothetical protein
MTTIILRTIPVDHYDTARAGESSLPKVWLRHEEDEAGAGLVKRHRIRRCTETPWTNTLHTPYGTLVKHGSRTGRLRKPARFQRFQTSMLDMFFP